MQIDVLQELTQHKIVAIVRGVPEALADGTAAALAAGGIRLLEVTMNTPGALDMITRWRGDYAGCLRIGAGTVLDVNVAQEAVAAGAEYLITPNLNEAVLRFGVEQGVAVWPGVTTPTEIVRAWQLGAQLVKIFPLGTLGIQYLKDIRAPLGHIPMMAVGGVDLDNVADFLRAGAVAAGLGSKLVDRKLIEAENFDELTALAKRYVEAVGDKDPIPGPSP